MCVLDLFNLREQSFKTKPTDVLVFGKFYWSGIQEKPHTLFSLQVLRAGCLKCGWMVVWMLELYLIIKEPSLDFSELLVVLLSPDDFLKSSSDSCQIWRNSPRAYFYPLEVACSGTAGSTTLLPFLSQRSLQDCLTVLGREASQLHLTYVRQAWPGQDSWSPSSGQGRRSPSDQLYSFPWTPGYAVCQFCWLHWQLCKTKQKSIPFL